MLGLVPAALEYIGFRLFRIRRFRVCRNDTPEIFQGLGYRFLRQVDGIEPVVAGHAYLKQDVGNRLVPRMQCLEFLVGLGGCLKLLIQKVGVTQLELRLGGEGTERIAVLEFRIVLYRISVLLALHGLIARFHQLAGRILGRSQKVVVDDTTAGVQDKYAGNQKATNDISNHQGIPDKCLHCWRPWLRHLQPKKPDDTIWSECPRQQRYREYRSAFPGR